jgi:hypothetical protein
MDKDFIYGIYTGIEQNQRIGDLIQPETESKVSA